MEMDPTAAQAWAESGIAAAVEYAPRVFGVIFIFVLGKWLAGVFSRLTIRALERGKADQTLSGFFGTLVRYAVLVFAGLAALEMFGIKTTSFVAVLGAAGFAVGLALQGTLSNFAAGVMLLFFRPFKIGDLVEVGGQSGGVKEISIFTTTLTTWDNIVITLGNSAIWGSTIKLYSPGDGRRVDVTIGVEYGTDLERAQRVLIAALEKVQGRDTSKPASAYVGELSGSSIDLSMRVWCDAADYLAVRERMIIAGYNALNEAGIGIPFQTIDLKITKSVAAAAASA